MELTIGSVATRKNCDGGRDKANRAKNGRHTERALIFENLNLFVSALAIVVCRLPRDDDVKSMEGIHDGARSVLVSIADWLQSEQQFAAILL